MMRAIFISLVVVISHSVYSAGDVVGGCPDPGIWVQFEDQCYTMPAYSSSGFKTWSDARDECMSRGGDLAIIDSPHSQAFLTAAMEYEQADVWIGLTNVQTSPDFTWVDGSSLDYTNWGRQQPDGFPGSTGTNPPACAVMMLIKTEAGKWNDQDCDRVLPFYCQRPVDPALTPPPPGGISLCRPNYISYFQGCFRYIADSLNYEEAEEACVKDMSHLATVSDAYDEAFIETLMYEQGHDSAWIGLSLNETLNEYKWYDDWPVYYTAWGASEPSRGPGEGCVEATILGHWDDTVCTKGQPFICKYTDIAPPAPAPTSAGYCDADWIEYGEHCYLFITRIAEMKLRWDDARMSCAAQNGTLLTVHHEDENQFILREAGLRVAEVGSKPHIQEGESDVWLAVVRNSEGGFEYMDGEPVNYVLWDTGEPHSGQGADCVVMQQDKGGYWATSQCTDINYYGCKKAKIPGTLAPPRTENVGTTSTTSFNPSSSTSTPNTPSMTTDGHPDGLSGGAIAGIVIATVVVSASLAVLVTWLIIRKRNSTPHEKFNDEIDISTKSDPTKP